MYMQAALQQTSNALAELDAVLSLASVAVDLGLVRPVVVADNVIVIKVRATACIHACTH
jgi:DNA mismatch repair ATPase MutS